MKLHFTLSNGTPTAHLVDGETQTALPVKMCKDGLTLEVPENPTNRRWLKLATLKEKVRSSSRPRKNGSSDPTPNRPPRKRPGRNTSQMKSWPPTMT